MPGPAVTVRPYKQVDLRGGTLLVSVPHAGIANILLTDFLLEQQRMDQVAALDSEAFPPFAMLHHGRARFPARIHADGGGAKLAVLRCEFGPPPFLARPIALALLDWAQAQGLGRIVVLDALHLVAPPGASEAVPGPEADGLPPVWFTAVRDDTRQQALGSGLAQFEEGVLDGVAAMMLLEGRFRDVDVVGLFVERRDILDDARGVVALARSLPLLAPEVALDMPSLEVRLHEVETAVRQAREQAEKAMERLEGQGKAPPAMYG